MSNLFGALMQTNPSLMNHLLPPSGAQTLTTVDPQTQAAQIQAGMAGGSSQSQSAAPQQVQGGSQSQGKFGITGGIRSQLSNLLMGGSNTAQQQIANAPGLSISQAAAGGY